MMKYRERPDVVGELLQELADLRVKADAMAAALDWALAECDGSTRYDTDQQRGACIDRARAALTAYRGK